MTLDLGPRVGLWFNLGNPLWDSLRDHAVASIEAPAWPAICSTIRQSSELGCKAQLLGHLHDLHSS